MHCTIEANIEGGIVSSTKKGLRCDTLIKFCVIRGNKDCGIIITGKGNCTRVEKNLCIDNNSKAGIKVENDAQATIIFNKINENFGQGILFAESTWGHIEGNLIQRNFKANIALGGVKASDSVILNNEIRSCRAEGIFLIEVGFCWIIRNKIEDNADGIVMYESNPHILDNKINNNMRSGIVGSGSSFPKVEKN